MKKPLAALLIVCSLCSCSAKRYREIGLPSTYYTDDTVSLSVEIPWLGGISDGIFSLIRLYDTLHPETRIKGGIQADANMQRKLRHDFSTGVFPDIFAARPSRFIDKLVEEDRLTDLSMVFLDDREWFAGFLYKQLWKNVRYNGRAFGLPVAAGYGCMFIDVNSFHSIEEYPLSLDELYQMAGRLAARGYAVFRVGTLSELSQLVCSLIVIYSGGLDRNSSDTSIRDAFVRTIAFLRSLAEMNAFEAGHLVQNNLYTLSDQKAAVHLVQDSGERFLADPDRYVCKPYPSVRNGGLRRVVFSPGPLSFYVSRDPLRSLSEAEAVMDFLHFVTYEGSMIYHSSSEYIINIRTDPLDRERFFRKPEIAEKYNAMLDDAAKELEELFPEEFRSRVGNTHSGDTGLKAALIELLEDAEYYSLPVDYFFDQVLDREFGIGIAELLAGDADAGGWWDAFFTPDTGLADDR